MSTESEYSICLITCSPKQSKKISRSLVEKKLVACVNIISKITSIYRWKEKVEEDIEDLLVCKTLSGNQEKIITQVKQIHEYDVPETIFLPILKGNKDYLKWIVENVE